jgi:hypothetical protein
LLKIIEGTAKNQKAYYENHEKIVDFQSTKDENNDMHQLDLPETAIERYNYYLGCLRSIID